MSKNTKITLETLKGNIELKEIKTGLLITLLESPFSIQYEMGGLSISDIDKLISKDNLSRIIEDEIDHLIEIKKQQHVLIRKKLSWEYKIKNIIQRYIQKEKF